MTCRVPGLRPSFKTACGRTALRTSPTLSARPSITLVPSAPALNEPVLMHCLQCPPLPPCLAQVADDQPVP